MFGRRKKRMAPPYDKAGKIPVIRSGICTGEQVAGFKDPETGKLIYRNVLARTQTECKTKLREATQDQYTNFLKKHLNPNIGDIPLEQLTSLRIQKMYQDLRTSGCIAQNKRAGTGLSQKTVRNIHMMLHVALDQAVKEGLLNKNPTDGCIPPKVEKKEMKVIQPEQIGAYLRAAEEHNVLPMFYLELTSGLRRGELLARCFYGTS